jgi:hypothetical protein
LTHAAASARLKEALRRDIMEPRADDTPCDQRTVDEADEDSFPASDPPAWTSTHSGEPLRDDSASTPPHPDDRGD